ncbi:MAG: helix-turn-helix transcriptional regulator [Gammaproteobacteria bacterium]
MKTTKILKALSNETRLQMLHWLKEPSKHFAAILCDTQHKADMDIEKVGVCVGFIQQKSGLSQSTTSYYLSLLQDAGLVQASRRGQWTYYKRDEEAIKAFLSHITGNL